MSSPIRDPFRAAAAERQRRAFDEAHSEFARLGESEQISEAAVELLNAADEPETAFVATQGSSVVSSSAAAGRVGSLLEDRSEATDLGRELEASEAKLGRLVRATAPRFAEWVAGPFPVTAPQDLQTRYDRIVGRVAALTITDVIEPFAASPELELFDVVRTETDISDDLEDYVRSTTTMTTGALRAFARYAAEPTASRAPIAEL